MGIFDSLLTGGVMIGKICQALSNADSEYRHDPSGTIFAGSTIQSGPILFGRRAEANGSDAIWAFNYSENPVSLSIPYGAFSLMYSIAGPGKMRLPEASDPDLSPLTTVVSSSIDVEPSALSAGRGQQLTLSFSGLNFGGVTIGSFKLKCTTKQLIIVSGSAVLLALTHMYLTTENGLMGTSTKRVEPIRPTPPTPPSESEALETEYYFDMPFTELGIKPDKTAISGMLTFDIDGSKMGDYLDSSLSRSEPLDEADRAFYQWQGVQSSSEVLTL